LVFALLLGAAPAVATQIEFNSPSDQTNLTSSGAPMDGGFAFELGVFEGDFVPTTANMASWAANWRPAVHPDGSNARAPYFTDVRRFSGFFLVYDNPAPWTEGKPGYVWGFKAGATASEWILFRAGGWLWPAVDPFNPEPLYWEAPAATPVIGQIEPSGTPFLMRSAAVAHVSPPTNWQTWVAVELAGEPLNGPQDDPERDGVSNLIEYVFGLSPKLAGAPPVTPLQVVGGYLRMTVPRRIDHVSAQLTVEVSSNLATWQSGPGHTVVVSDTPAALVVRDAVPFANSPRRFMRLRAVLPPQ
jgi:hypothetical protein